MFPPRLEKKQLEIIVEERTVEIRHQRDEIQVQERKSHSLLLNILPGSVADELKSTGAVQPVGFDDVTVCFTDFVGFTLSSETLAPAALVDALNACSLFVGYGFQTAKDQWRCFEHLSRFCGHAYSRWENGHPDKYRKDRTGDYTTVTVHEFMEHFADVVARVEARKAAATPGSA